MNTVAVSDDSQFFITGSKNDRMINIWSTSDIERDVTSHSLFSIKTERSVNCVTTLDNSYYFASAGSHGCIDIFQVGRLDNEQFGNNKGIVSIVKNSNIDKNTEFSSTSIVKTIQK